MSLESEVNFNGTGSNKLPKKVSLPQRKNVSYPDIYEKNGYVYKKFITQKGEECEKLVCKAFSMIRFVENVDTGILHYELNNPDTTYTKPIILQRNKLIQREITNLLNFGFDVFEFTSKDFIKHLKNLEDQLSRTHVHEYLGFHFYNDVLTYRHNKIIGNNFSLESTYMGKRNISSKGTHEGFIDIIKNEVLGYTPTELALTIGLSAPVIGMVAQLLGTDTLLVHAHGKSTTGKTIAARLAVSPMLNS